jgi:hypothetical protein
MNWIGVLLASTVVAAIVSGIVAVLTSERHLASENVIQERKNWREHVREIAAQVYDAINCGESDANKFRELRAKLALRLNPHDADDQEILALVAPGDATRAEEFNRRVALLLKHDWERAKRDANLMLWLCTAPPARVKFNEHRPGDGHDYARRRWFARPCRRAACRDREA